MPAPNSSFNELAATTLNNYMPNFAPNIFQERVLLKWVMLKGNMKPWNGGDKILTPLEYAKNDQGGNYAGADIMNTNIPTIGTTAQWEVRQHYQTVGFTGIEKRKNREKYQMVPLIESRIKNAQNSMRDRINTELCGSQSGIKLEGLGNLVPQTDTASVGGIDPTVQTWWQVQGSSIGGFAANGISKLIDLHLACSRDGEQPDFHLTSVTTFAYYEKKMEPRERYLTVSGPTGEELANFGFPYLTFKATPVFFERAVSNDDWIMLNSNHIFLTYDTDVSFQMSDFIEPINQDAALAKILFYGNLILDKRSVHGRGYSITA